MIEWEDDKSIEGGATDGVGLLGTAIIVVWLLIMIGGAAMVVGQSKPAHDAQLAPAPTYAWGRP